MKEDKVVAPAWLVLHARVRKNGAWPRLNLPDGAEGTVTALDVFDGHLRRFTVLWDNHPDYPQGVEHFGWHATHGNVAPVISKEGTP